MLTGLMVAAFSVRTLSGEARVAELSGGPMVTLRRAVACLLIGPAASGRSFVSGPIRALRAIMDGNVEPPIAAGCLLVVVGIVLTLVWRRRGTHADYESWKPTARLAAASLALLVLGYGLAFTHHSPTVTVGRMTSVHLAATVGAALLAGVLWHAATRLLERYRAGWLGGLCCATYVAILVIYGVVIQQGFVAAADNQRNFWTQVVRTRPDLEDGTTVLVIDSDGSLPRTRYIKTPSWADPIILSNLLRFPETWERPPGVFVYGPEWSKSARVTDNGFEVHRQWDLYTARLTDGNVIVLEVRNARLVRMTGTIELLNNRLTLKSQPDAAPAPLPPAHLYEHFVKHPLEGPPP